MNNLENYFIKGDKISLRPLVESDSDWFFKWYNDFDTRIKTGISTPCSYSEAKEYASKERKDSVWFAIIENKTKKMIGETGLIRMYPAWQTTDLSIIIPDPQDQHQGFGKEAIYLMMNYAFGYLNYHRIAIGVVGFNEEALKFYERVGFKKEGIQEDGYYINYKYYDFIMMRILKSEFVTKYSLYND